MDDNNAAIILSETRALAKEIAMSQLLPQALKQKPFDVLAIVLTGRELGLEPMQSIRGIHIIEGKASLSADLMGALVKRSPACEYLSLAHSDGKIATYKTKRKGEPGETVMSFTIEQAIAAGAEGKANWKRYPDAMLRARALSAICRAVYPDVCLGVYDSDSGELTGGETVTDQPASTLKDTIRAQVTSDPNVVDGEVVTTPDIVSRITAASTLEALNALKSELVSLSPADLERVKPAFIAAKTRLTPKE